MKNAESPNASKLVSTFSSRSFGMLSLKRRQWQVRDLLLVLPLHRNRKDPVVSQNQADLLHAPKAGHCHQTSVASSMVRLRCLLQQRGCDSKLPSQEKSANCGERVVACHCRRKGLFSTHEPSFQTFSATFGVLF